MYTYQNTFKWPEVWFTPNTGLTAVVGRRASLFPLSPLNIRFNGMVYPETDTGVFFFSLFDYQLSTAAIRNSRELLLLLSHGVMEEVKP